MSQTIHEAAARIRRGESTPLDVLDVCLKRIDRYEAKVKAWVLIDRDGAREQAELLTEELKRGNDRGPLHGIPIAIKDIFDVFDWPTAAGSPRWANSYARADCTLVKRLRQAGAVILGKTVTTQYASFDPPPTRNPWNLERTPGGSSSGSAAALACGMCLGALGSQTGGSLTRPATFCGVTSFKPTYGRVTLQGTVPLAHSMDHPGPMARCVQDLAILLQVLAGPDPLDPVSRKESVPDYRSHAVGPLWQPKLGMLGGMFNDLLAPEARVKQQGFLQALRDEQTPLKDIPLPVGFGEVIAKHRTVMAVEAAQFHGLRLRKHPEDYLPNIRSLLEEGLACPAPEYASAKEHQQQLGQDTLACFDEDVEILIAPATRGPAPDARTTGDPAFNSPWSYVGFPALSIPAGWSDDGLPLGIQLIGPPWAEAKVLAAAAWCEQVLAFPGRDPS